LLFDAISQIPFYHLCSGAIGVQNLFCSGAIGVQNLFCSGAIDWSAKFILLLFFFELLLIIKD